MDGIGKKVDQILLSVLKKTEVLGKECFLRVLHVNTVLSVRPDTHWSSSGYFVVNRTISNSQGK